MSTIPNENIELMAEKEEPRFLNLLLKDKECLKDAVAYGITPRENGKPGHFLIDKNNFLYIIIRNNFLKYGTLLTRGAMDSIVDMMSMGTDEDKASMKLYWDKIWNRHDVTIDDYTILKEHINDRYLLNQFYSIWKDGDQIVKSNSNHGNLIKKFINDVSGIKNIDPDAYSLTMDLNTGMDEAIKYIDNRKNNPSSNDSIMSGISAIDKILHGFARPSYTVVSGLVNGGKTTFLMNIGLNMAKAGYKVAYVSLEKDAKLFYRRILSRHALVDYNRIKSGGSDSKYGLSEYWYKKLLVAAKDLKENIQPKYYCLQFVQNTTLTKILSEVDRLRTMHKLDVLIVDYLQVIGTETNTVGRYDVDLANIHKRLMAYGRQHNLSTFTALQLKSASAKSIRDKATKVKSEADLSSVSVNTEDYAGSQMIIADADNGIGVVLNGDKPPTKMLISFSKARDDESRRTIEIDFDGRLGKISDPEYGEGKIKVVDDILFNKDISEDDLASEDNLFDSTEKEETKDQEKIKERDEKQEIIEETKPEEPKEEDKEVIIPEDNKKETDEEEFDLDNLDNKSNEKEEIRQKGQDMTEKPATMSDDDIFKI